MWSIGQARESHDHLFFACQFSSVVVKEVCTVFLLHHFSLGMASWMRWATHLRHTKLLRVQTWFVVITGLVHGFWTKHNNRVFTGHALSVVMVAAKVVYTVKRCLGCVDVKANTDRDWQFLTAVFRSQMLVGD